VRRTCDVLYRFYGLYVPPVSAYSLSFILLTVNIAVKSIPIKAPKTRPIKKKPIKPPKK